MCVDKGYTVAFMLAPVKAYGNFQVNKTVYNTRQNLLHKQGRTTFINTITGTQLKKGCNGANQERERDSTMREKSKYKMNTIFPFFVCLLGPGQCVSGYHFIRGGAEETIQQVIEFK